MLLAGVAIIFPLFNFAPKLYKWLVEIACTRCTAASGPLKSILHKDVASTEVAALEADLAGVDRAIHLLSIPMQHSDLFFSIKSHLDLVRSQLGLRRTELPGQSTEVA